MGGGTDIFEHFDFGTYAFDFGVVLVFEFGEDGVAILASARVGTLVSLAFDELKLFAPSLSPPEYALPWTVGDCCLLP